jgi:ferredoxin--NADP+ reductase
VLLDNKANGFFTVDRLPDGEDLWLLATGTGLAPYLSILQQPEVWQRFAHIVLVHCVRDAANWPTAARLTRCASTLVGGVG